MTGLIYPLSNNHISLLRSLSVVALPVTGFCILYRDLYARIAVSAHRNPRAERDFTGRFVMNKAAAPVVIVMLFLWVWCEV